MTFCENDTPLFNREDNGTKNFIAGLETFQAKYGPVHGYLCFVICIFGIVTNLVHVLVLTRPTMRTSAVNCILTAVAICDMGTMGSYLTYILHFVLDRGSNCRPRLTYGWIQFLLWHVVLSIALHTTSLWLAVAMAFIRRMTLRAARLNSRWQQPRHAWKICLGVYIGVFTLCVPTMLVHDITALDGHPWRPGSDCSGYPENYTQTRYTIQVPEIAKANGCRIFKLNLWMTGLVFKVIPCVLLFILSIGLMTKLRDADKKRRMLLTKQLPNQQKSNCTRLKSSATTDRTTLMLLTILLVFLVTELPQGFIAILNAIYTTDVHTIIYFTLGDVLDLLSLINSSVNFILYCVMSSRYRQTFWAVVLPAGTYRRCCGSGTSTTNNADTTVAMNVRANHQNGRTISTHFNSEIVESGKKPSMFQARMPKFSLQHFNLKSNLLYHGHRRKTNGEGNGRHVIVKRYEDEERKSANEVVDLSDSEAEVYQPLHTVTQEDEQDEYL